MRLSDWLEACLAIRAYPIMTDMPAPCSSPQNMQSLYGRFRCSCINYNKLLSKSIKMVLINITYNHVENKSRPVPSLLFRISLPT